jgi:hypothetical protein
MQVSQYQMRRQPTRPSSRRVPLASVLTTCVVHGINPQDYLTDVLLRVQTHPETELDDLLPHRWKPLFGPAGPVSEAGEGAEDQ